MKARPKKKINYFPQPQGLFKDKSDPCNIGTEGRRQLVSMYYLHTLNKPSPSEWTGWDGTIFNIIAALKLDCHRDVVHRVLVETDLAIAQRGRYLGDITVKRGRPQILIEGGSVEQQILVNYQENGCSYTLTIIGINVHRFREGKPPVGRTAVVDA